MISLTEAFLAKKAVAYPCGKLPEARKMLNELPEFRGIDFVSVRGKLRSKLEKGSKPASHVEKASVSR